MCTCHIWDWIRRAVQHKGSSRTGCRVLITLSRSQHTKTLTAFTQPSQLQFVCVERVSLRTARHTAGDCHIYNIVCLSVCVLRVHGWSRGVPHCWQCNGSRARVKLGLRLLWLALSVLAFLAQLLAHLPYVHFREVFLHVVLCGIFTVQTLLNTHRVELKVPVRWHALTH